MSSLKMSEFLALNPTFYSVKYQALDQQHRNKNTLKGVSKVVVKREIQHDDYVNTLQTNEAPQKYVISIRIINHQLYTLKQTMTALTTMYDHMKMVDQINCIHFGYGIQVSRFVEEPDIEDELFDD